MSLNRAVKRLRNPPGFAASSELQRLQNWVADVGAGRLPRREFLQRLAACGVAAPVAGLLLSQAGVASAQTKPVAYKPTRRGGGGTLKLLFWQAPTLLNPHFASGVKDAEGCALFYEPLVIWDNEGQMLPVLAAEIPSRENGGLAADGKSVLWRLKKGVNWHDGKPFTADDVVFNWLYATDKATSAYTAGSYLGTTFEKVDEHSVRVRFEKPTPFWPGSYSALALIPKHLFAPFMGANAREAPTNLRPVGTGPFKITEFKPGDTLKGAINTSYHQPNRPHFDAVDMKGGGDATSAARAVLQTGEFDYGWNIQVEDEVLKRIEAGGKGRMEFTRGGDLEHIQLMLADPWSETEGERGHPKSRNPYLGDVRVRRALAMLVDRKSIQQAVYGRLGEVTTNYLAGPPRFRSSAPGIEYNPAKAEAELDAAGWPKGSDGQRAKDGKKLKLLFASSQSSARQKVQTYIKANCTKAGIEVELKATLPSVFFSTDSANPDVYGKSWADLQLYAFVPGLPDPVRTMQTFTTAELSQKSNGWVGLNRSRYQNPEYDRLYKLTDGELDPLKRAALFIRLNDLAVGDVAVIPLVHRAKATAILKGLVAPQTAWSQDLQTVAHWYREG